jgi:3-oxoadipate enol-lactonase
MRRTETSAPEAPGPHANVPAPTRTLDIQGFRVRIHGPENAPPIVLLHGLLLDGHMWDGQVSSLSQRFRVIVPDFPGHGESPDAPKGYTLLQQAADIGRLLDTLGLHDAVFAGFSMGGMTAMQFAVSTPSRVRALALVNTSADAESAKARARFSALALSARIFGVQPWLRKRALEVMFGPTFRREHPDVVAWWDERLGRTSGPRAWRSVQLVVSRPAVPRLESIRVPTLVVAADEDIATPPFRGRRIADALSDVSFQLIPRCGHCSPIEQPELVSRLLDKFCERVYGVV